MSLSIVALPTLERGLGSDGRWSGAASAMSGGGPTPEARGRETYPRRQMPGSRQPMSSGGPTPEARGRETTLVAEEQRNRADAWRWAHARGPRPRDYARGRRTGKPCRRMAVGPRPRPEAERLRSRPRNSEDRAGAWGWGRTRN